MRPTGLGLVVEVLVVVLGAGFVVFVVLVAVGAVRSAFHHNSSEKKKTKRLH